MKGLAIVVLIFLGFPVYFLPAYLAAKREHPKRKKILLWNLLTAWTGIGWVVLIFMAAKNSGTETILEQMEASRPEEDERPQ